MKTLWIALSVLVMLASPVIAEENDSLYMVMYWSLSVVSPGDRTLAGTFLTKRACDIAKQEQVVVSFLPQSLQTLTITMSDEEEHGLGFVLVCSQHLVEK